MKKEIFIKEIFLLIFFIFVIAMQREVKAGEIKQTWRINPNSNLQEIALNEIDELVYSKDYSWSFIDYNNHGWEGKTVYGGGLQGSVVTDRHIIFTILNGGRKNGYIYIANKKTGKIEQSISVESDGSTSIYGHMNDMTYNPNTKEVFMPYIDVNGNGKVVIFKYNSNGSLNTSPTIVNQCEGLQCGNMDYNISMDKYIFNAGNKVYVVSRSGEGFKSTPDKTIIYDQMDFKYMVPQSIASTGKYFYKMFYENGEIDDSLQPIYVDEQEQFSCIAAVYEIETGKFVKALYIPNTTVAAELEGISFDPTDNSMILSYNYYNEQEVKFYKLKTGNQVIGDRELYFYYNGLVAPKATITAEDEAIKENIVRYYNGSNNLGDGHSNYTKTWNDLSGNFNGNVIGTATFTNNGHLYLDGKNNWVNMGIMPNSIYNKVTMEICVSFSEIVDGEVDLLSNMESGGYALLVVDGKPAFQAHINGTYKYIKLDEKLLTNRLYNITGVFDGESLLLYIDGALRGIKKIDNKSIVKIPNNNTVMAIGTNPNGNNAAGCFLNGEVYSARVYQSALNQADIQKNMNADRVTNSLFPDKSDNVKITINFSEPVDNFTIDDIDVKNGNKGSLLKKTYKQYELDITDITPDSNLEISIENESFTDLTGNKGIGTNVKRYRDATNPNVVITMNKISTNTTKYTITFNEKISGFNIEGVLVSSGIKSNFVEVDERKTYTVLVSNDGEKTQTIIIPEGSVYDSSGNYNIKIEKQFTINEKDDLDVNVNTFKIIKENGTNYIENITPNTTIESLNNNIETNGEIKIYKGNILITDEKQLIGTGMKVVIKYKEQEERFTTIVIGDLTGNGKMEIVDLLKLVRHVAKLDKILNNEHLKAADIVKDGKYANILDILKMSRVLAGLEQL